MVHPARGGQYTGFEGGVDLSQRLPVRLEIAYRGKGQSGVVGRVRGGSHDRAEGRLAGGSGQRRGCTVNGAGAGLPRRHIGGQLPAGGVVGVHMHG